MKRYSLESSPPDGLRRKTLRFMKAKEVDRKVDKGEDVIRVLDVAKAERPAQEQRRVSVDFPT